MELESLGSLPVASLWWRLGDRPWTLTVVCKGTLDLTPGELRLAAHQDGIVAIDQAAGGNRNGCLYVPADLAPYKPRPEISLVGWAYAPRGTPTESVTVRLSVADLDKSVQVVAEDVPGSPAQGFVSAPLSHELAAGGPGTLNPVGVPPGKPGARPRLLPVAHSGPAKSEPALTGLGPVAAHWPSRRRLLHGKAAPVLPSSGGELVLPGDFDLRYFNAAPADQQLKDLPAGATLLLENLHPSHPVLRTRLPRMSPQVFVVSNEGERFEQVAAMDTVWIDTQRLVATVTWRVVLELGPPSNYKKAWVVITEAGKRLTWDKLVKLVGSVGIPVDVPSGASNEARSASWQGPRSDGSGSEADAAADSTRGSETLAMPERFSRFGKDEDTQTEVTASVLLDPSSLGASKGPTSGIPAWLARSGPASPTQKGSGQPNAPPSTGPTPAAVPAQPAAAPAAPQTQAQPQAPAPAPVPPAPVPRASGPGAVAAPVAASVSVASDAATPPPTPSVAGPLGVRPPQPSWMAAGGVQAEPRQPWEDTSSYPKVVSSLARPSPPASRRRDVVELLWFDPAGTRRVRKHWAALTEDLEFAPVDPRHDLPTDDPQQARDRHTHFGILTEAPTSDAHELPAILKEAVNDQGRFTPPLVVLAGRLQFPFDELEILRATAAALTPLAGDDKKLKESLGNVKELLDSPLLQHSNELIENFVKHLRSLYDGSKRAVSRDYLDTSVERMLLEQRRYQKRSLFDGSWIRALLSPTTSGEAIPTYMPESLDKTLPMMVAFRARLVVEVHVKQDQYESHPHALRVVSLGRVLDIER